jgi:putative aldouronate transport system permease protein
VRNAPDISFREKKEFAGTIGRDWTHTLIAGIGYGFVSFFTLLCMLPLIMVVSGSFSDQAMILKYGYSLLPRGFSTLAYEALFSKSSVILGSFLITVGLVVFGAGGGLFLTAMTGYTLQRHDFRYRNLISFYIYFTTLFSGGLVSFYLLIVKYLHLNNSYFAVLLPGMLSAWNIFMMKNFLKSIPYEITEAAKIDGAGDFGIFIRIILPLSKPSLATIGLFLTIHYWNEWYNSMLFLSPSVVKFLPLQLFLYNALNTANFIRSAAANITYIDTSSLPSETMKMSIAVVSTLPIIFVYPFIQRYFITGITIGGVKG